MPTTLEDYFEKYQVPISGTSDTTLPYLAFIRGKLADARIKNRDIGDVELPPKARLDPERSSACYGLLREKLTARACSS